MASDAMARLERSFPVFILVASSAVLGGALLSQYWGGLAPCELCLKERWPWVAAIAVAVVATTTGSRRASPRIALLLAAIFAIGAALAFDHVGVERHWFAGPAACTAPAGAADTIETLRAQLLHQMPVRCDQPAWSLWGISLAGWNLVASLAMAGICAAVFAQLRPRGRRAFGRSAG
jgi:disulfide bond formation protein DsbB